VRRCQRGRKVAQAGLEDEKLSRDLLYKDSCLQEKLFEDYI
jgi:hypothetical protein